MFTSMTGFTVRNLNFLRTNAERTPNRRPIMMEKKESMKKPYNTLKGVVDVNSLRGPAY